MPPLETLEQIQQGYFFRLSGYLTATINEFVDNQESEQRTDEEKKYLANHIAFLETQLNKLHNFMIKEFKDAPISVTKMSNNPK